MFCEKASLNIQTISNTFTLSQLKKMGDVFRIEDLDSLTTRKTHDLTRTEIDTIKFLRDIKLLPKTPRADDECRNKCNNWKLEKRAIAADGEEDCFARNYCSSRFL
jgi:hypothetical protein